jgi:hypothetical protein
MENLYTLTFLLLTLRLSNKTTYKNSVMFLVNEPYTHKGKPTPRAADWQESARFASIVHAGPHADIP